MASFALSILQNAAKIASEAHVHRAYVSQLERGLKTPTLETPFAIAAALGACLDNSGLWWRRLLVLDSVCL